MEVAQVSDDGNIWFVLGIMLLMGLLGGTINHLMKARDDSDDSNPNAAWAKALVIGIGASVLIPLFLNTISSSLLADVLAEQGLGRNGLVLAGFCLLAAISSRAFIETLSQKVLKEAREAKAEASQAKQEVEAIADSVAEPSAPAEPAVRSSSSLESLGDAASETLHGGPKPEELGILQVIENSKYTMRSTWGIAQDINKDPDEAKAALQALQAKGWVALVDGKKGPRWVLTANGRNWIRT